MSSNLSYKTVDDIALATMHFRGSLWHCLMVASLLGILAGGYAWLVQLEHGLEWSGISHPVNWGTYISNFVFWIGIAHAGTLISAILYLTRSTFRVSIHRIAEAITVFSIFIAALFPVIHLGRAWYAFWVVPYPHQRDLWPNFSSPLVWDAFAISVYFLVSLTFFLLGLIPDCAALRDRCKGWRYHLLRVLSFGFKGLDWQWFYIGRGYLLIAALLTPLVISVHSIVAWDFAVSSLPGWHSTLFAPYFVVGAIFSGSAMVLLVTIVLRFQYRGLQSLIRVEDLEAVAKLLLMMACLLLISYGIEFGIGFYSGSRAESSQFWYRALGDGAPVFWPMLLLNGVLPMLLWKRSIRNSEWWLFLISLGVCIGMWIERFLIITASLSHGLVPFTWDSYRFQWVEIWITIGSFSLFLALLLAFVRSLPSVAVSDLKRMIFRGKR